MTYLQETYEIPPGHQSNISTTPVKYLQETFQISPEQQTII